MHSKMELRDGLLTDILVWCDDKLSESYIKESMLKYTVTRINYWKSNYYSVTCAIGIIGALSGSSHLIDLSIDLWN